MRTRVGYRVWSLVVASAALALAGCSTSSSSEQQHRTDVARARVAELARSIGAERPDDINGWARAAVTTAASPGAGDAAAIELIGIEALQSDNLDEPFGRLDFRVPAPELDEASADGADGSAALCFRVAFDYYGKVGEWSTSDGVEPFECPADAAPVVPPADDSVAEVVAVNAREVARTVLLERAATGLPASADDIASAIASRLEPPAGPNQIAATPYVVVDDTRVGVAMGVADDCVLVKSEGDSVEDVYPPPVLLQPGELGCAPGTALTDPEQLRSPH